MMGSMLKSTRETGYCMGDSMNGYSMRDSCGDASVERSRRQLDFFGRDGRMVEDGRIDMGNNRDSNNSKIGYSQRESCGEERSCRTLNVRFDGRGGHVGCDGHDRWGQGFMTQWYISDRRRIHNKSKSRKFQRSGSQTHNTCCHRDSSSDLSKIRRNRSLSPSNNGTYCLNI